jgi:hypothetical protein
MPMFMCTHTLPPAMFSSEQIRHFEKAAREDPTVKGYRNFAHLGRGKVVCVMEAADKETIAAWFRKMGMPFDSITKLNNMEGDSGKSQPA